MKISGLKSKTVDFLVDNSTKHSILSPQATFQTESLLKTHVDKSLMKTTYQTLDVKSSYTERDYSD